MILKSILKGMTSVLVLLLALVVGASTLMFQNEGIINRALNVETTKIEQSEEDKDVDAEYYKNEYGTDIKNYATALEVEKAVAEENLRQAEEGTVLLKNENEALPLDKSSDKVTVFGNGSYNSKYNKSKSDSSMNEIEFVTFNVAMKNTFKNNVNLTLSEKVYGKLGATSNKEIVEADLSSVKQHESTWKNDYNDAAIVVLTRWGSEDAETVETYDGRHYMNLSKNEEDMMKYLQEQKKANVFDKIIVIINADQMMELGWFDTYGVDACLLAGIPGQMGFQGVVNVMVGDAAPSGRTVDTYVKDYTSSPAMTYSVDSTAQWSNIGEVKAAFDDSTPEHASENHYSYWTIYAENIYVGYKYYETRYEDSVMSRFEANGVAGSTTGKAWSYADETAFPFGYGLSFANFKQTLKSVKYNADTDTYTLTVTVKNESEKYTGKSVVQVYAQTPYGEYEKQHNVEKSAVSLVGFTKTADMKPKEEKDYTVEVEKYLLASYDSDGAKGYIISEGINYLAIGDNAHDALNNILALKGYDNKDGMVDVYGNAANGNTENVWTEKQTFDADSYNLSRYTDNGAEPVEVTNQFDRDQLSAYGIDFTYLSRKNWNATYPKKDFKLSATKEMIEDLTLDWYEKPADAPSVDDFKQDQPTTITFVTLKDVAWGEDAIWDKFIDQLSVDEMLVLKADGNGNDGVADVALPSQGRGDDGVCIQQGSLQATGKHAFVWVSEVITSRTWNKEHFTARGHWLGIEAVFCGLNELWYGGGNIHRTPFGGRNMQYYSEDGNFGYYVGWYEAQAMQEVGIIYGIKHFVLNDQELYRESLSTFATEQSMREIYLRAFEGPMCKGKALGIMTGFNRIGTRYVATNPELLTGVLKDEWNFKGHLTTDAGSNSYKSHALEQLVAGIDYTCWNTETDTIRNAIEKDKDGYILQCLRLSAKHNLYAASRSITVNNLTSNSIVIPVTPWWQTALVGAAIALTSVAVLCLAGYIFLEVKIKKTVQNGEEN